MKIKKNGTGEREREREKWKEDVGSDTGITCTYVLSTYLATV